MKQLNLGLKSSSFIGLAAFQIYALLPLLPSLAWLQVALVLMPFLLGVWSNSYKHINSCVLLGLTLWSGSVYLSQSGWFSGETLISGLLLVLGFKWFEAKIHREYKLLATLSLIPVALSSLYFTGLVALLYLVIGVLLYLVVLLGWKADIRLKSALYGATRLLLFSLPMVALLFVTVPRIQGPLWDLGIVLGLPIELMIDQEQRQQGLTAKLQAGQISRLKKSDQPVLVAEFDGVVPYKSKLYWRGPVYEVFDGISWSLPSGWDNRSQLLRKAFRQKSELTNVLSVKQELVSYEARISAHGERFMYGLDFPVGRSAETFISSDFQVLGIRPLSHEFNYQQIAYLQYQGGRPLGEKELVAYVELPAQTNPQLQAWGRNLASQWPQASDRIQALRVHLAEGGYQITQTPDIAAGMHSLDEFFFSEKLGGVEHLASSTAVVLRAAGVPTRLVAGFRGGRFIAPTKFFVVRQANAHVWVEAWLADTGWQRIEALDFVLPPEPERAKPATSTAAKPFDKSAKKSPADAAEKPVEKVKEASEPKQKKSEKQQPISGFSWLKTLNEGMENWILNYNPERQVELMKKSGIRKVDWKSLLAVSLLALLLVMVFYGVVINLRRSKIEPLLQAFMRLDKGLKKREWQCLPEECPSQWLGRLRPLAGELYPACEIVIQQYIQLRYEQIPEAEKQQAIKCLQRDIKRLTGML
ncbi:MAG: transglutaminase family protein [Pseudomonadales bacterium]